MRETRRARAAIAVSLVLGFSTVAASHVVRYDVGPWGAVIFELPEGWTAEIQDATAPEGEAIRFLPPPGSPPMALLATPLQAGWGKEEELAAAARKVVEDAIRPSVDRTTLEPSPPLLELEGAESKALYYSWTDRTVTAPTEDDFRYAVMGVATVRHLMMTFTFLTNDKNSAAWGTALEAIRGARYGAPGTPWRTPAGGYALRYPGKSWRLALDLPGFEVPPIEWRSKTKAVRLLGENHAADVMITVFLERAGLGWSEIDHREEAWRRLQTSVPAERTDVRRSERRGMAILEHTVPVFRDERVPRRHVNAHLVRDGIWIDVHLSKARFKEKDQKLFDAVLDSVRFEE